ncbi:MAG TPA: protein translocase subunit SecF [Nocardioidaceae bacterium]|jgi:preprotein translocase subunit SecF|nr:protein translocase subunit SecF [Nocardioidaceae bacterium]
MSKLGTIGARLYRGDVSVDFVGRRKTWYLISLAIMVVAISAVLLRGISYGIEFKGGVEFEAKIAATQQNVQVMREAVVNSGVQAAANPVVTTSGNDGIRIETKPLTPDDVGVIEEALTAAGASDISHQSVGPTWGKQVANKALIGLLVFLVLVVLFIWAYFREWRMSAAAIVALAHDLVITIGVYAITGFEVTPATVTGLLTILGYSLYDTVVVFDKVRENTRGLAASNRLTYADAANQAVNQTLVRSINTSLTALLPVGAILWVGAFQLGSGPLKDLALVLFVGMAAGTYSSVFIATPLLVQLKMREPAMVAQARRVAQRRHKEQAAPVAVATAPAGGSGGGGSSVVTAPAAAAPASSSPVATPRSTPARSRSGATAKRAQPSRQARSKRRPKGSR